MKYVKHIITVALLALLAACGGGGGGDTSPKTTTVSGVATKGVFKKGGTVAVYPVNAAGVKGAVPLAVGNVTDDNGTYSVNIGDYSGPIIVEAYGAYADEATGADLIVPASAPLRAALDFVTTGIAIKMPVTPLTDLAYRQAGPLTPANIRAANDNISYLMRMDIINTMPVATTADAFASATQSQKDYSLILAAVSQIMAATPELTLEQTMASLNSGLATTATATALNNAMTDYIANPRNQTGVATVPPSVQNLGTTVSNKKLVLSLSGDNVASVQAFSVTLTFPDGLYLRTDAEGIPLPLLFKLSGSAALDANNTWLAKYTPASGTTKATLSLSVLAPNPGKGLTSGEVISITCDTAGAVNPVVGADNLSNLRFWDGSGSLIIGPVLSSSLN